ncbi:MAG: NAD/NADP octopine/nopaline dehydrogenase family protein [Bacteroides sp.]|nr:NAD/NADP octopine/nopaline dehydrogenase family protein [Bacteroides sp.]
MMDRKPTVCICGGGSLGTVIAGVASSRGFGVNILTGKPEKWSCNLTIDDPNGRIFNGTISRISDKASEVIPQSDIIILCLPGNVIHDMLVRIKPYISENAIVGSVFSSTGFFIMALDVLGPSAHLFGFQRVPFISRIQSYGHSAHLLGYKKSLNIAYWNVDDRGIRTHCLEEILMTPINELAHPIEVTLTNSNPILHPARLYTLFRDHDETSPFDAQPLFYEDWTDESSRTLIACDNEFQALVRKLGIEDEVIPSLLDYYESTDDVSLTAKIRSIAAFKGIYAPTKPTPGGVGYIPDYDNRYFSEDIPFGMMLIKYMAEINGLRTPMIDEIIRWYEKITGKNFLDGSSIADNADTACIQCLNRVAIRQLLESRHV